MRKLLGALALVAVLAACGSDDGSTVHTGMQTQDIALKEGQKATLTDSSFSPSVGDSWTIVSGPDAKVAILSSNLRDCDQPGCTGQLDHVITASGPGTTTITFQYCYRSAPPDCQPKPGEPVPAPVAVTVTVT